MNGLDDMTGWYNDGIMMLHYRLQATGYRLQAHVNTGNVFRLWRGEGGASTNQEGSSDNCNVSWLFGCLICDSW